MYIHVYTCTYVIICMHVCMYVCTPSCMHACMMLEARCLPRLGYASVAHMRAKQRFLAVCRGMPIAKCTLYMPRRGQPRPDSTPPSIPRGHLASVKASKRQMGRARHKNKLEAAYVNVYASVCEVRGIARALRDPETIISNNVLTCAAQAVCEPES